MRERGGTEEGEGRREGDGEESGGDRGNRESNGGAQQMDRNLRTK